MFERPEWSNIEQEAELLDHETESLLAQIEGLTEEVALNAEEHEKEFMLVNTGLGISAFIIGVYITFYIIISFRRRVADIQGQIDTLHVSISGQQPPPKSNTQTQIRDGDELADLAANINGVIDRFADEMHNRYEIEQQLIQLATTDKLTGAYNRHKWDEMMLTEIELASRGTPLSILILDLDHFKKINDSYGHDIGDLVLVEAVRLIKEHVRKTDLIFR